MKQLLKQPGYLFLMILAFLYMMFAFTVAAHAQKVNGKYHNITTERTKEGALVSRTTKFVSGSINVSSEAISVDTERYTIIKHEKPEIADEGMYTQNLLVVTTTKAGKYKVLDCILLLTPEKYIKEVIFRKTKATLISYAVN